MGFDSSRSFEVENGITLSEGGAGVFSDMTVDPTGHPATTGSKFIGTDGSFWTKFGAGDNDWKKEGKGKTLSGSLFNGNSEPYLKRSGATYSPFAEILFPGTDNFGDVTKVSVLVRAKQASKAAAIRVYDNTNGQAIAEITSFNNTSFMALDMGALLNTPSATEADWEIQGKRVDSGGECWCAGYLVEN